MTSAHYFACVLTLYVLLSRQNGPLSDLTVTKGNEWSEQGILQEILTQADYVGFKQVKPYDRLKRTNCDVNIHIKKTEHANIEIFQIKFSSNV